MAAQGRRRRREELAAALDGAWRHLQVLGRGAKALSEATDTATGNVVSRHLLRTLGAAALDSLILYEAVRLAWAVLLFANGI